MLYNNSIGLDFIILTEDLLISYVLIAVFVQKTKYVFTPPFRL